MASTAVAAGSAKLLADDDQIKTPVKKPLSSRFSDEIRFHVGVVNLLFSTWLLTAYPHCYWCFHLIKSSALHAYRLVHFMQIKWQLYLLEFCYTVNYWTYLYFVLCPLIKILDGFYPGVVPKTVTTWLGPILFRVAFAWVSSKLPTMY